MADSSTTAALIQSPIAGGCWAQRQLRSRIKDVSVASKLRKSQTLVRVVFIDTLAIPELDGRFLHNHFSNPESDSGRLLGSMPAMQQYRVRPCCIKAYEIALFCAGGIRYPASDILLDGGYLHNQLTDLDSVCGRLLGLTPAFQLYKVRLCRIKAQEVAVFCGEDLYSSRSDILLDGRLLHTRWTDLDDLCGRFLGLMPASHWYKVRLCHIEAQEFAVFCGGCIRSQAGDILLDGRLLYNRLTDPDAPCGRLLRLTPASQLYKVCLCLIKAHEFAVFCGGCIRY